ncbi:MAG: DUF4468 domain-containing protein [Prevotella sp.]|nr:DUF4468 domain-containing protein [Prevotella sp.]
MRRLLIVLFTILATNNVWGQEHWQVPADVSNTTEANKSGKVRKNHGSGIANEKKEKKEKIRKSAINEEDLPYLEGAIPEVNGKVVFEYDIHVPGKNATELFDMAYDAVSKMTKGEQQISSRIVAFNKSDLVFGARFSEWLEFSNNIISLDRTVFNYTLVVSCQNEQVNVRMDRLFYKYEEGLPSELTVNAEEWITDKYALNKQKTKILRISKKFRKKTVDRKNEIFKQLQDALTQEVE